MENERLLKIKVNFTLSSIWMYKKSIIFSNPPSPIEIEFFRAATKKFLEEKIYPTRKGIIEEMLNGFYFINKKKKSTLERLFSNVSSKFSFAYTPNPGLIGMCFIRVIFIPRIKLSNTNWNSMFNFPGIVLRFNILQGNIFDNAREIWNNFLIDFYIPRIYIRALVDYFNKLDDLGIFINYNLFFMENFEIGINFNDYIPNSREFTINVKDEEDNLIFNSYIDYIVGRSKYINFFNKIKKGNVPQFSKFLGQVYSPYVIGSRRYGSFLKKISSFTGRRKETIKEWLEKYVLNQELLFPHPITFYYLMPPVPTLSSIICISRSTMTSKEKANLGRIFPIHSHSLVHSLIKKGNYSFWQFKVPPKEISRAFILIKEKEPLSKNAIISISDFGFRDFQAMPWFDVETGNFFDPQVMFDDYFHFFEKIVEGESINSFKKECLNPWIIKYEKLKYAGE
ncbi:MAG: hypothetical protein ACTSUE_20895 [Promethearchaeota archaeon]